MKVFVLTLEYTDHASLRDSLIELGAVSELDDHMGDRDNSCGELSSGLKYDYAIFKQDIASIGDFLDSNL